MAASAGCQRTPGGLGSGLRSEGRCGRPATVLSCAPRFQAPRGAFVDRQRSKELYAAARERMPGGVNSPARSWSAVGGDPLFIERGLRTSGPGRGRQRVHRLRVLVGSPDTRACPPGGGGSGQGGGGERDELRGPDRDGERARRPGPERPALSRPGQVCQLRHGGRDERPAAGEGLHGAKQDREVRGRLPRAYGRPAGRGGLRRACRTACRTARA